MTDHFLACVIKQRHVKAKLVGILGTGDPATPTGMMVGIRVEEKTGVEGRRANILTHSIAKLLTMNRNS